MLLTSRVANARSGAAIAVFPCAANCGGSSSWDAARNRSGGRPDRADRRVGRRVRRGGCAPSACGAGTIPADRRGMCVSQGRVHVPEVFQVTSQREERAGLPSINRYQIILGKQLTAQCAHACPPMRPGVLSRYGTNGSPRHVGTKKVVKAGGAPLCSERN